MLFSCVQLDRSLCCVLLAKEVPMFRIPLSSALRSLVMALSVFLTAGAVSGAGTASEKDRIESRELAQIVARESFKDFGKSTEGTVLARFSTRDNPEPLGVWVYRKGVLHDAGSEELSQALGADRQLWPPYTLLFRTFPEGKDKLRLEVSVRYDMGLLPDSRGGFSSTWKLERRQGRWVLVDRKVDLYID